MNRLATMALVLVLAAACGWIGNAQAVELRYDPQTQNIGPGETGRVAIWLDEPLEIRTIELTVAFDDAILDAVDGYPGAAFDELSCQVWGDYVPETGQWYGFAVSLGADCFVVGPGELFVWEFETEAIGTSPLATVSVLLADRYADILDDVTLPDGAVIVGDGVSPVGDELAAATPVITAQPNPFNPLTSIRFSLPGARHARLAIFDVEGRRVRTLLDGLVPAGWSSVRWDGRTDGGLASPSGVYLYRLVTDREQLSGRVTLTR